MAVKLANVFLKENVITDKQYKRSVFGIEVMLTALAQLSGLLIIALALNLVVELMLFMTAFVTLRHSAGGYHATTAFKCFLMTSASFLIGVWLSKSIAQWQLGIYVALVLSMYFIFRYAPQDTPHKPFKEGELKYYRKKSVIVALILFITIILMYYAVKYRYFAMILSMGVMFESISLIPLSDRKNEVHKK